MEKINLFWRQNRQIKNLSLREKENENNVTHALLILLQKNNDILNLILKRLKIKQIKKSKKEVIFQVAEGKYHYKTIECKNKYILFIKSKFNDSECDSTEIKDKQSNIPDGLIIDDKSAILIEAKVSAIKDTGQLKRYNEKYFNWCGKIIETTWEDIHSIISTKSHDKKGERAADFLLDEFKEYLEVIHLSGFSGIPFFKPNEDYNSEDAVHTLTQLMKELKEKDWFKRLHFKGRNKPNANTWDYFCAQDIKSNAPIEFPHYSIYVFYDYFGIDCLFHKNELKVILQDEQLFKEFTTIIQKLAKSPDYYFRATHYKLLANKKKAKARRGESYTDLEFLFQLQKFIKKPENWQDYLKQYLNLIMKQEVKQFSIIKKVHYEDKEFKEKFPLSESAVCFEFIKSTIQETSPLYDLTYKLYKDDKQKK